MEDYKVWAEGVLQKVREKMDWCSEKNRDKIPYTTDGIMTTGRMKRRNGALITASTGGPTGSGAVSCGFYTRIQKKKNMRISQGYRSKSLRSVLKSIMGCTMT